MVFFLFYSRYSPPRKTAYHPVSNLLHNLFRRSAVLIGFTGASVRPETERMDLDYFLMHQLNNKFTNQPVLIDRLIIANLSNHNPQDFFPGLQIATCSPHTCYLQSPLVFLCINTYTCMHTCQSTVCRKPDSPA